MALTERALRGAVRDSLQAGEGMLALARRLRALCDPGERPISLGELACSVRTLVPGRARIVIRGMDVSESTA